MVAPFLSVGVNIMRGFPPDTRQLHHSEENVSSRVDCADNHLVQSQNCPVCDLDVKLAYSPCKNQLYAVISK